MVDALAAGFLMMSVEEALVALKVAGAREVTVVFDLAQPSPPSPSSPTIKAAPSAAIAVREALDDDPLYRSTSSRPVRISPLASDQEDDDGLD